MSNFSLQNAFETMFTALDEMARSHAVMVQALSETVPGFRDSFQELAETEKRSTDRFHELQGEHSVKLARIELARQLAKMIAKEAK